MRGSSTVVSGDSIAVLISPGATALTRMPSRANSAAISRVKADNAAFDEEREVMLTSLNYARFD